MSKIQIQAISICVQKYRDNPNKPVVSIGRWKNSNGAIENHVTNVYFSPSQFSVLRAHRAQSKFIDWNSR